MTLQCLNFPCKKLDTLWIVQTMRSWEERARMTYHNYKNRSISSFSKKQQPVKEPVTMCFKHTLKTCVSILGNVNRHLNFNINKHVAIDIYCNFLYITHIIFFFLLFVLHFYSKKFYWASNFSDWTLHQVNQPFKIIAYYNL